MKEILISANYKDQLLDITDELKKSIEIDDGICIMGGINTDP